ncbi:MAG TPA: acyl-CoA dehydrogenase family protein [Reyranella sp.]|nr:acyl-CoA dehydrogenase family protein [Reyranella sp.]
MTPADLREAARRLAPKIRAARDYGEQHRHLEPGVLAAMHEAKLFRMLIPADTDGLQADLATAMEVVEIVAEADGAVGWNLMIGMTYGIWASRLPPATAREIYGAPDAVVAGALRPSGTARPVAGGYVCDGRWSFASGIGHSAWWTAGCGEPGGSVRLVFFPADDGALIDTWTVGGMRGTGSHDYAIEELFVPAERTIAFDAPSRLDDLLYRLPLYTLLDSAMATVPLGIARAAIDAFVAMAGAKTSHGSATTAANRPVVQADLGRAEAVLQAARTWLYTSVAQAWNDVQAGRPLLPRQLALMRLARANALTAGVQAVDLIYAAAGSASVYSTGVIDRCFRDIHVAAQHTALHPTNYEACGGVLLGLPPPRVL